MRAWMGISKAFAEQRSLVCPPGSAWNRLDSLACLDGQGGHEGPGADKPSTREAWTIQRNQESGRSDTPLLKGGSQWCRNGKVGGVGSLQWTRINSARSPARAVGLLMCRALPMSGPAMKLALLVAREGLPAGVVS